MLNEQTILATQMRNLVPLGLMLIILAFHILEIVDNRAFTRRLVIVVSCIALSWLLVYLGGTVSGYCQGKQHSRGLGLLEQSRLNNIKAVRHRFGVSLTLYYFTGLITVASVFADIYAFDISQSVNQLAKIEPLRQHLVVSRQFLPDRAGTPSRKTIMTTKDVVINQAAVLDELSARLTRSTRPHLVEVQVPETSDFAMLTSAVTSIIDLSLSRAGDTSTMPPPTIIKEPGCRLGGLAATCPVLLFLKTPASQFANDSISDWDAFLMSSMILISVGLTDNPPVSAAMKASVAVEELIGALFFFIYLVGLLSALTD